MRRFAIGVAAAALALAGLTGTAAAAGSPIQPHQYFTGVVNGRPGLSSISVAGCSPATGNGHPLAGQTTEVIPALFPPLSFDGYTGNAHLINVDLDIPSPNPWLPLIRVVHLGQLSNYHTPLAISTFLTLPCQGQATAVFSPVAGGAHAVNSDVQINFDTPRIAANPSQGLTPGTVTTLTGTGFAPNSKYHIAECSQTSWIVPQYPCDAAINITTGPDGGFVASFTVDVCATPIAGLTETCYIGAPMISGIDGGQLVGPAKITVTLRPPFA